MVALQTEAESRFRATEQQLEEQLNQTEERLSKLQTAQPGSGEVILTTEQAREIERFQAEKLRIRKELRAVKSQLERDIKSLGMWTKVINVLGVPALFALIALLVAHWHRRRRHAIAMLRKTAQGAANP